MKNYTYYYFYYYFFNVKEIFSPCFSNEEFYWNLIFSIMDVEFTGHSKNKWRVLWIKLNLRVKFPLKTNTHFNALSFVFRDILTRFWIKDYFFPLLNQYFVFNFISTGNLIHNVMGVFFSMLCIPDVSFRFIIGWNCCVLFEWGNKFTT